MRPVVLPPTRDEIELAERVMTFWAVKYQEWEMSVGWGWSVSLADEECTRRRRLFHELVTLDVWQVSAYVC